MFVGSSCRILTIAFILVESALYIWNRSLLVGEITINDFVTILIRRRKIKRLVSSKEMVISLINYSLDITTGAADDLLARSAEIVRSYISLSIDIDSIASGVAISIETILI